MRAKNKPQHWGGISKTEYRSEEGGPRLMRSVIYERNEHGRAIHPTQKPLGLLSSLIRYSTPPEGSVVVPFAGSGSDLMAARNGAFDAVGFELDPVMAEAARVRLAGGPLFAAEA